MSGVRGPHGVPPHEAGVEKDREEIRRFGRRAYFFPVVIQGRIMEPGTGVNGGHAGQQGGNSGEVKSRKSTAKDRTRKHMEIESE